MKLKKPAFGQLQVYRVLTWVFGLIILLALIIFFARGWIRYTVEPKTAAVFYGQSVQATLDQQTRALGDPLTLLKYTKVDKHAVKCGLVFARSFHTQLDCSAMYHSYGPVSSDKQVLRANAVALQAKLDKAGWAGNPVMPLTQFINGITDGADYQPDATYLMHFGTTTCMLSTTTAFSKPRPPAMNTDFSCSKTVNLFGNPLSETNPNQYF